MTVLDIAGAQSALDAARAAEAAATNAFDATGDSKARAALLRATQAVAEAELDLKSAQRRAAAATARAEADREAALRSELAHSDAAAENLGRSEAELVRDWSNALLETIDRELAIQGVRLERAAAQQSAALLRARLGEPMAAAPRETYPTTTACDLLEAALADSPPARRAAIEALVDRLEPGRFRVQLLQRGAEHSHQLGREARERTQPDATSVR